MSLGQRTDAIMWRNFWGWAGFSVSILTKSHKKMNYGSWSALTWQTRSLSKRFSTLWTPWFTLLSISMRVSTYLEDSYLRVEQLCSLWSKSCSIYVAEFMNVEEGSSQESTKVLAYLQETKSHIQPFIESRTSDLTRKVNKEDCIAFFKRNGFFRSYTIRQTIAGKR